jgi:tRNA-(ms[2]io[6]A)-hydroxylase
MKIKAENAQNRMLAFDLGIQTTSEWVDTVMADFDSFLQDHASCEKKASGMALSMLAHYPDKPDIVAAMGDLAVEELSHFREVLRLLGVRNISPAADVKDPYINALNKYVRRAPEFFLLDRLLVAAIVEKRGHERFDMLMHALPEGPDRLFYKAIVASEERHYQLFLHLANQYFDCQTLNLRLSELLVLEAEIVRTLPLRAALH